MTTAKLNTVIIPKLIVVSILLTLLMACSYNTQIVENAADGTQLDIDGSGTVIHGNGNNISGHVHIAEVFYSDGSFWSQGKPTALEKWINKRSRLQIRFIPQQTTVKSVYLSPPRDVPAEKVDSDGLFNQPRLLLDGKDTEVYLSVAERENLRRYLVEKGGFSLLTIVLTREVNFIDRYEGCWKGCYPHTQLSRYPTTTRFIAVFIT